MVLDTSLFNTQHYNVRIKGKLELSRETNGALDYGRPIYFLYEVTEVAQAVEDSHFKWNCISRHFSFVSDKKYKGIVWLAPTHTNRTNAQHCVTWLQKKS